MKLILLNNCYPSHAFPQMGTYAKTIAERLEEAEHDVRVVALVCTGHKAKDYMCLFAIVSQPVSAPSPAHVTTRRLA